jgi:hypothetical protein
VSEGSLSISSFSGMGICFPSGKSCDHDSLGE